MPRKSNRQKLLSKLESLISKKLEIAKERLLTGDMDSDVEDDDNDDIVWHFMYHSAVLQSRYLARRRYRSSTLPSQICHADLDNRQPLPWLTDAEFLRKYRVSRNGFQIILDRIKDHPVFKKGRRGPEQAPVKYERFNTVLSSPRVISEHMMGN